MIKILWLAPNFNHYKARFLNHLAMDSSLEMTILAGVGRKGEGDKEISLDWEFDLHKVAATKKEFGLSKEVRMALQKQFNKFEWVLIPAEKKNIVLFLFALSLQLKARWHGKQVKLFSYNHPVIKSGNGRVSLLDRILTRFYFYFYDKVIFYTEQSCQLVKTKKYIDPEKAFWANNTIDTSEVRQYSKFCFPPVTDVHILFIGRLIPSKRVDLLLDYYKALKMQFKKIGKAVVLEIIGDGPENIKVKEAMKKDPELIWHGTLVHEERIAPIMERCSMVFIPGLSGLSINHAFSYGRPYLTLASEGHGPEISYMEQGVNGYILQDDFETNVAALKDLLTDRTQIELLCNNAYKKSEELSVDNWVQQFQQALH